MTMYFEDLTMGDGFRFGSYTVDQAELIGFAEAFDPQPFHVDPEAAEDSIFGGLVASGLFTLSLTTRLTVEEFYNEVVNLGGKGMDELRWHEPVRPGDTLSVRVEVLDKRPSENRPNRGYVDFERALYNQRDDEVMSVIVHNIVERRPTDD